MAYSRQDIAFINNAKKIVSDFQKKIEATAKKLDKIDEECAARALERKQPHLCKMETYNVSIELWNKKMKERFGLTVDEAFNSLESNVFNTEHENTEVNEPCQESELKTEVTESNESEEESFNWQEKILG